MSITQIVTFQTTDGKTFSDESSALAHEESLSILPLITQFAHAKSDSPRAHTRNINLIREWEAYKASGGTMAVEKTAIKVEVEPAEAA